MAKTRTSTGSTAPIRKQYVDAGSDVDDYVTRQTWRGKTKKIRKKRDDDGNPIPKKAAKSRKAAKRKGSKPSMKLEAALTLPTDLLAEVRRSSHASLTTRSATTSRCPTWSRSRAATKPSTRASRENDRR